MQPPVLTAIQQLWKAWVMPTALGFRAEEAPSPCCQGAWGIVPQVRWWEEGAQPSREHSAQPGIALQVLT